MVPQNHTWKKISERIKSAKEYSKENQRKNMWKKNLWKNIRKKIRERIFERKSTKNIWADFCMVPHNHTWKKISQRIWAMKSFNILVCFLSKEIFAQIFFVDFLSNNFTRILFQIWLCGIISKFGWRWFFLTDPGLH